MEFVLTNPWVSRAVSEDRRGEALFFGVSLVGSEGQGLFHSDFLGRELDKPLVKAFTSAVLRD